MQFNNCVSAGLVDEWLKVRHVMSIENFFAETPMLSASPDSVLDRLSTASSGD